MTESFAHADFKSDLYWSIVGEDEYAEVEKSIGRTRTDVFTEINGHTVAIEIQHTRIPIKSILRRMREHTEIGAYTLWLITPDALIYDEERCRNLNWVMFIQKIQGQIFLPGDRQTIIPARVDNQLVFHKEDIIAGKRKFLDQTVPIELTNLRFEKNDTYDVNVAVYDDWWTENYLDLIGV